MLKTIPLLSSLIILTLLTSCSNSKFYSLKEMFAVKNNRSVKTENTSSSIPSQDLIQPSNEVIHLTVKNSTKPMSVEWLGSQLNDEDKEIYIDHTQTTLETIPIGIIIKWHNPNSSASGTTTPIRTFKQDDKYCREFSQTIKTARSDLNGSGIACRHGEKKWLITESHN